MIGLLWSLSLQVYAATSSIRPSGTNDALYTAIRQSTSGDTLVLQRGLYQECVDTLGKDLVIRGEDGAQIVGNGSCPALLEVSSGEVWTQKLTFSHKDTCVSRGRCLCSLSDASLYSLVITV